MDASRTTAPPTGAPVDEYFDLRVAEAFEETPQDSARAFLRTATTALRRLEQQIEEAPNETAIDLAVTCNHIKVTAERLKMRAEQQLGNEEHGLTHQVIEWLRAKGLTRVGHYASGKTVALRPNIWARTDTSREEIARLMATTPGYDAFAQQWWYDMSRVSAHVRHQIKEAADEQGVPITEEFANSFLPDELRDAGLRIDVTHKLSFTGG